MSEESTQVASKQKPQSKNKWFLFIGIVILILILVLGGAYFLNNSKNSISLNKKTTELNIKSSSEAMENSFIRAIYVCADNKMIDATFNNGEKPSVNLVLSDGVTMTLPRVESASGGKYANEDQSVVFWNGGNDAYLEENAVKIFEDCTTGT